MGIVKLNRQSVISDGLHTIDPNAGRRLNKITISDFMALAFGAGTKAAQITEGVKALVIITPANNQGLLGRF